MGNKMKTNINGKACKVNKQEAGKNKTSEKKRHEPQFKCKTAQILKGKLRYNKSHIQVIQLGLSFKQSLLKGGDGV